MVGFRVFDVGLLIVWLVWFFRLRDDQDDLPEEGGGDGGGGSPKPKPPRSGPGPGGLKLPLGRWPNGSHLRDGHEPSRTPPRRRPVRPGTLPARVRSPGSPTRITRRA
jgi:hypothetical protein